MTDANQPVVKPRNVILTLRNYKLWWIVPTVVLTLMTFAYGVLTPATWEATQALLLRDEGVGNVKRHGRFENLEAMKTAQNTVLELVRNNDALAAALSELGPPQGYRQPQSWPTLRDIEKYQKDIALKPPKGAEFGSTEVIYLSVQAKTAQRALKLADAVFAQLEQRLQQLRNDKAQSTIVELDKTVEMAKQDLETATVKLTAMETEVGSDLADLRNLNDAVSGESSLHSSLRQIQNELRQAQARQKSDAQLQEKLQAARQDSVQLVAMPNSLLSSQPALRRLKDGLVDAQLRTAQLLGTMREAHPAVQAALEAEREVHQHLHDELEVAIRGLATDLEVSADRAESLELKRLQLDNKLDHLARLRARYDNLEKEVNRRSEILESSERDLADGRATLAAANSASLITQLETPHVGDRPLGPSLLLLTFAGLTAGLVTGLGLVFLIALFDHSGDRRWSDRLFGRRRSDSEPGKGRREQTTVRVADGQEQTTPARRVADSLQVRRQQDVATDPIPAPTWQPATAEQYKDDRAASHPEQWSKSDAGSEPREAPQPLAAGTRQPAPCDRTKTVKMGMWQAIADARQQPEKMKPVVKDEQLPVAKKPIELTVEIRQPPAP